jgi:beta-glucanase (GH16 family)
MFLNKLSGEGLFDERPRTQTSLGRFVLEPPETFVFPNYQSTRAIKGPSMRLVVLLVLSLLSGSQSLAHGKMGQAVEAADGKGVTANANPATSQPAFADTFAGGTLDATKWFIDTGRAPGNIAGVNSGTLSAEHVDLSTGMLRLTLNQSVSGALATSVGAEIRSKQLFGYGTYVWVARAASTSATPRGPGSAVSGSVTDVFNFINDSESEIDFEYQGQSPATLEMTNFATVSKSQSTTTPVAGADGSFHEYKYVWSAAKIEFYVDGTLVSTHTEHIPSAPAAVLINLWGTNSTSFGGVATDSVTRYLYVSSFSYTLLP